MSNIFAGRLRFSRRNDRTIQIPLVKLSAPCSQHICPRHSRRHYIFTRLIRMVQIKSVAKFMSHYRCEIPRPHPTVHSVPTPAVTTALIFGPKHNFELIPATSRPNLCGGAASVLDPNQRVIDIMRTTTHMPPLHRRKRRLSCKSSISKVPATPLLIPGCCSESDSIEQPVCGKHPF